MNKGKLLDKIRLFCEYQLREVQTDNLYFGYDKPSNLVKVQFIGLRAVSVGLI